MEIAIFLHLLNFFRFFELEKFRKFFENFWNLFNNFFLLSSLTDINPLLWGSLVKDVVLLVLVIFWVDFPISWVFGKNLARVFQRFKLNWTFRGKCLRFFLLLLFLSCPFGYLKFLDYEFFPLSYFPNDYYIPT